MNLDRNNFKNQTFDELPELVQCSNFEKCTFNGSTKFDRCNLRECTFTVKQHFLLSNVINSSVNADCVFEKSNNIIENEEELILRESRMHRFEENE